MGAIIKRGTRHAPRFYAQYRDTNGVRRTKLLKGATTGEQAKSLLASIELNITNGKAGIVELTAEQQERASITVREISEKFLKDYDPPGIKNIVEYRTEARSVHKRRILPTLGYKAAAEVTRSDVERLRDMQLRVTKLAPNSVGNTLRALSRLYTWARREGYIECANPAEDVERPQSSPTLDYLDKAEVGRLLAKAEELAHPDIVAREFLPLWPMVTAAIFTGMRKGELFGLRWCDVHLEAGRIDVTRSYRMLPKSGESRYVPIHPELARVLRVWKKVCPKTDDDFVFPIHGEGKKAWWHMGSPQEVIGLPMLLAAAECHVPVNGKHWHLLRHTFASHAVMSRVSIFEVSKLLGHHSVELTAKVYAHLAPDHLAAEVARLSFAPPSPKGIANMNEARRKKAAQIDSQEAAEG